MKINTNTLSQTAQRYLGDTVRSEQNESIKLSSGDRIYTAAVDPSGLAISEKIKAKLRSQQQAGRNANDAASFMQVAEGVLSTVHSLSGRLKELALQSANDTIGDAERGIVNLEFQKMKLEAGRLIKSAKFNGHSLLNNKGSVFDFQVGVNGNKSQDILKYDLSNILDSNGLFGIKDVDVSTRDGAQMSLGKLDRMLVKVSASRAKVGSSMNRLEKIVSNLKISNENAAASNSRIRDTDIAESTAQRTKDNIKKKAGVELLDMSNRRPEYINKLLS